jgi:hypothetical protein
MPVDLWPAIAASIPKPWPPEAVSADLLWYATCERLYLLTRPGRPALMERWGWSDWKARQALAGSEG